MPALRYVAQKFQEAKPFPHLVLPDFEVGYIAEELAKNFPTPDSIPWYHYDNPLEKKLAMDRLEVLPEPHASALRRFNSPVMLEWLRRVTGIEGLIPDNSYRGGGCHQILPGGKLDIHEDFNVHPITGLHRRLNAILFLNKDWKEEYGGHLELWNKEMTEPVVRILPTFNTLVVFATDCDSYHGHPEPLTCPEGMTRKSMAAYYYTKPINEKAHSTIYKRRPQDDVTLDSLREERARHRLKDGMKL